MLFAVFLFFLLSPLLFENWVIEPTNVPRFLIASLALTIGFIVLKFKGTEILIPSKILIGLALIFYGLNLIGLFWAFNSADLIYESQKIILGIGVFLFFFNFVQSKAQDTFLFQGVVISLILVLTVTGWDLYAGGKFQSSLFGHKNLLSSFLFLCLPFLLFRFGGLKSAMKVLSIVLLLATLTILFFLNTRAVFIAIGASIFFFVLVRWSFIWNKIVRRWIFGIMTAVVILFIGFVANYVANYEADFNANRQTSSLVERIQLWNKTGELVAENPVLGVGTGNWQYNYSKFGVNDIEKARYFNTFFKRPHNDFLWILSENGLVGFLLILFLLGIVGWFVLKDVFANKDQSRLILLAAFIGLMVIASFSFPKERMTHICLSAILMAYLLKDVPFFNKQSSRIKPLFFYALIGIIGFNLLVGWERMLGEYHTKKSIASQANLNPDGAIENGLKAISPFYSSDPSGTPIWSYIGWGYNRKTDLTNLLEANRKAYQMSPFDYKVLSNYSYALLRVGQFGLAREILDEAYRINQNYEPVRLNFSVLEFNEQHYAKSLEWLISIPGYETKYSDNLGRIQAQLESVE